MKKIRIYLDTNMILDIFINHAKAIKKDEIVLLPKKYEFMLANKENIEFVTSFITKAEVVRELCSGFGIKADEIERLWNTFSERLNIVFIEKFMFDTKLCEIAAKCNMKLRTLFNFTHLIIAIEEKCYFVSGDNDMIQKIRKTESYNKAITYIELRKMIEEAN